MRCVRVSVASFVRQSPTRGQIPLMELDTEGDASITCLRSASKTPMA